jgi:hypothetical protein
MNTLITNIDGVKWEFKTDEEFISFTQAIFNENELSGATEIEDMPEYPETFDECENYIENYCGNLLLQTADEQYFNYYKSLYGREKANLDFEKEFLPELDGKSEAEKQEFYRKLKR